MPDSNLSLIASPSLPQAPRLLSILAHSSVSHRTAGGLGCRQGRPPAAPLVHGAGGRGWRPLPGGKRGMPGDRQLERGGQPGGRRQAGWRPLPGEFRGQRAWRACGSRLRTNTAELAARAAGTGCAVQQAGPDLLPPTPQRGTGRRAGQRAGPGWWRRFLPAAALLQGVFSVSADVASRRFHARASTRAE